MDALLPIRHPNLDFFVCDIFDVLPGFRDDRASMEHPIFSLSTKPDMRELHYEHNGTSVTVKPSGDGLATIHDKDVLLYAVSHLRAAMKAGKEINQRVRLTAYDLLVSTNRPTAGVGYKRLEAALNRLRGTTIVTNIETGGSRVREGFGIIDSWKIIEKTPDNDRMVALEVKLSDWFFRAVLADELLGISRKYFRLRKPLERRLYELGRKHCGDQSEWAIGLEKLKKKAGSSSPGKKFKYLVKRIVEIDRKQRHFPDYGLSLTGNDILIFHNRRPRLNDIGPLPQWALEKGKEAAPQYDIYALEREFREWVHGRPKPDRGYGVAFVGFCQQKPPQPKRP